MTTKHAVITPEMVARSRSRIGQSFAPAEPYFNVGATKDTIRHFVNGIGDRNPLYRNGEYARKTRYGCVPAPSCFLYSVYWPCGMGALMPGMHGWHSGNEWTWYRPILEGDEFSVTVTMTNLMEKPNSRMAGRTFIGFDETIYKNQRGEIVAKAAGWSTIAERAAAGEKGKYREIPKATYTPEQMKKINDDYDNEVIRGAKTRFWEDVQPEESMGFVIKGPLSLRDMNAWLMGGGSPYMKAHGIFMDFQKRHPAVGMLDSTTGQVDVPELVHMEESRAQEIGVAGAYDYGCQRMSWLGHILTNWAGDDGFIKKMYGELRRFNVVGDTTWIKGRVVKKYMDENGEPCVDVDCWGENQRGEITMPGHATIILPSREKKYWPLENRLQGKGIPTARKG